MGSRRLGGSWDGVKVVGMGSRVLGGSWDGVKVVV